MATTAETRPEWLPDEYEHIQVTPEEIRQALDRDAQRHFGLTADEFLAIYRDPPGAIPRRPGVSLPDLSRLPHCRAERDLEVDAPPETAWIGFAKSPG